MKHAIQRIATKKTPRVENRDLLLARPHIMRNRKDCKQNRNARIYDVDPRNNACIVPVADARVEVGLCRSYHIQPRSSPHTFVPCCQAVRLEDQLSFPH